MGIVIFLFINHITAGYAWANWNTDLDWNIEIYEPVIEQDLEFFGEVRLQN